MFLMVGQEDYIKNIASPDADPTPIYLKAWNLHYQKIIFFSIVVLVNGGFRCVSQSRCIDAFI